LDKSGFVTHCFCLVLVSGRAGDILKWRGSGVVLPSLACP
jgi:hypothetical protein